MSEFLDSFLDAALISARLRDEVPGFVLVGTARDFANAQAETLRAPSAWVIILAETASEPRYAVAELLDQVVTVRFGVVMAVRDIADRTGAAAREALRPIREQVHRAICSWQPVGSNHACRFSRGALTSGIGKDGMMFWQDEFTVSFDRRIHLETTP